MTLAAAVGLASSGMLACPKARAGIWSTTPELSASGEYSTNPQLIPGQSQSGSALVANLGAPFGWYDEAHQVEFGLRARIAEATGSSPIGHDAYYGSFSAKTDYERGSVGLAQRPRLPAGERDPFQHHLAGTGRGCARVHRGRVTAGVATR